METVSHLSSLSQTMDNTIVCSVCLEQIAEQPQIATVETCHHMYCYACLLKVSVSLSLPPILICIVDTIKQTRQYKMSKLQL